MTALQPEHTRPVLRGYICGSLLGNREIADDENLLLGGLLDSLAVMSLVTFTEQEFGLKIPFEDVVIENFETIEAIAGYLETRAPDA